jgi:hypothetical protein
MKVKLGGTGDGGRGETCENPEYAVVPWGEYERRIVEAYGHASIQHVITVLYRYNTVRNDFVDLKIMIKNTKTETATGSILRTRRRTCESSFNERKQATHTALLTSSTATDPAMSLKHVKENKLSTGDVVEGIH